MRTLSHFEKLALSELLKEIKEGSLQYALREIIFSEANVLTTIKRLRPELK